MSFMLVRSAARRATCGPQYVRGMKP